MFYHCNHIIDNAVSKDMRLFRVLSKMCHFNGCIALNIFIVSDM